MQFEASIYNNNLLKSKSIHFMQTRILGRRLWIFSSSRLRLGAYRQVYYFSNLPKPSRFSQETGLQGEFENLKVKVQKYEKDTVNTYERMILIMVCIFGSLTTYLTFKFNLRSQFTLFLNVVKLSVLTNNPEEKIKSLQKVIEFQKTCHKNRNYRNSASIKILSQCLRLQISCLMPGLKERYIDIIEKALVNNLNNEKNISRFNSYAVYRRYFEKLLYLEGYSQSENLHRIVRHFARQDKDKDAQVPFQVKLQLIYLLTKLKREGRLKFHDEQKECLRQNLKQLKEKLVNKQQTLQSESESDSSNHLLLDPHLFECKIHKKWVVFSEQNLKG